MIAEDMPLWVISLQLVSIAPAEPSRSQVRTTHWRHAQAAHSGRLPERRYEIELCERRV